MAELRFLDLFAGAGGLSEGFIQAGFKPVAHIESDKAACFTLQTRMAYHWLKSIDNLDVYVDYLNGKLSRTEFYKIIPEHIIKTVINMEISENTLKTLFNEIDDLLKDSPLDLIVGGPPCQAYSLVGRSCDSNKMLGDKRNYLYKFYGKFLQRYQPKYFVFENVLGLLSAKDANGNYYFQEMRNLFKKLGYETEYRILNANDYGALQARKRIILVGRKGHQTGFYPQLELDKPNVLVNEIFTDLPAIHAGEGSVRPCKMKKYTGKWLYDSGIKNNDIPVTWHIARPLNQQDSKIYRLVTDLWSREGKRMEYNDLPENLKTHKNRTAFADRFKVVAGNLSASHTVLAHLAKDGHYYIHPDSYQNRSITPREAARLQTFPDDYYFEGGTDKPSRTAAFRQIGNAVPVILARKIAENLKENWHE